MEPWVCRKRDNYSSPLPITATFASLHEFSKLKLITKGVTSMEVERRQEKSTEKAVVRYKECNRNHAVNSGGHAVDGCGEFMPSGEDGTVEALKCAACDCHRNFHRRELEGVAICDVCRKVIRNDAGKRELTTATTIPGPSHHVGGPSQTPVAPLTQSMPYLLGPGPGDSDDGDGGGLSGSPSTIKKRFRTKFTTEQKERMGAFAEKLGWKIQKHDEAAVQEFCAEVGVKRHVLKVWMHNNKHTIGKKVG